MRPHGLDLLFQGHIDDEKHITESTFQGHIIIENTLTKEQIIVPMQSFVIKFINILQKLFSGSGGAETRKSSVSWSGSTAKRAGLIIGNDETPVVLSDDKLGNPIIHASVSYGNTTLIAPYVVAGNPNKMIAEIKKIFSNNKTSNINISEIGLFTKAVGASSSSVAGINMLARDLVLGSTENPISVSPNASIRFTFKFEVGQNNDGYGGLNLNFVKLVYNLFFKGNQNNPNSLLVNYNNQAINNFIYSSTATSSYSAPWYLNGSETQPYIGIVVGTRYSQDEQLDESKNPPVGADERIMNIKTNLTYNANSINSVVNSGTNEAQFTISRNITNNNTNSVLINRVGLIIKGNSTGSSLNTQQAFIAIVKIDNTRLEPGQTYKAMFTFKIRA